MKHSCLWHCISISSPQTWFIETNRNLLNLLPLYHRSVSYLQSGFNHLKFIHDHSQLLLQISAASLRLAFRFYDSFHSVLHSFFYSALPRFGYCFNVLDATMAHQLATKAPHKTDLLKVFHVFVLKYANNAISFIV